MSTKKCVERTVWRLAHEAVGEITPAKYDATLNIDGLSYDSLDHIGLCMAIEEAFEIDIADEDYEKWETVGDIVEYTWKRVTGEN